jgi:sulfonate transport system substrate-binding protein
MVTRRTTLGLFAAGAVLSLAGVSRADTPKSFRIGFQKGGVLALAKARGAVEAQLKDRGIAVEWNEFTSGPPLLEALGAGALDFGSAILVKKSSPIQTLADLKGKNVAFKRGSSAHNFIIKALESAKLTLGDVTPFDLSPPDAAAAFASGQIDAWAIWDPYYAVQAQNADTRVLVTTEGLVDSYGYYLANGSFTKANGQVITDALAALKKTGDDAQAHLDDTAKAISALIGVPEPIEKIVLGRKGADLGSVVPLNEQVLAYQQGLADAFFKLKIVPRQLDIKSAFWTPSA